MNWEEAACLDFVATHHERMFLESWYTKSDNNSINICRDMPGAYYSLIVSERARADSREQTRELSEVRAMLTLPFQGGAILRTFGTYAVLTAMVFLP